MHGVQSWPVTRLKALPARLPRADRKSLLLGTALASTLLIGTLVVAPTPAHAVVNCLTGAPVSPGPINPGTQTESITCVNTDTRTNAAGNAIDLHTDTNDDSFITLDNSGTLTASIGVLNASGISTFTETLGSFITITNSGDITAAGGAGSQFDGRGFGIRAYTLGADSGIDIDNSGDITATGGDGPSFGGAADGIYGRARLASPTSAVTIVNSGDIRAAGGYGADFGGVARGIFASTEDALTIVNSGDITTTGGGSGDRGGSGIGIAATTGVGDLTITNSGHILVTTEDAGILAGGAIGILARASGGNIDIVNSGDIEVSVGDGTAPISGRSAVGFQLGIVLANSAVHLVNSGDITATGGPSNGDALGMDISAYGANSTLTIVNSGDITAVSVDRRAYGIKVSNAALLASAYAPISIVNSGDITVTGKSRARGIFAGTPLGSIQIENSGSIFATAPVDAVGILAISGTGATIVNSGTISSSMQFAIDVRGAGTASIFNTGTITGFVDLTEQDDTFTNQSGGVFETKLTSLFGGGNDLFRNQAGGTVLAATDASMSEMSSFAGLERFENSGTISMVDGAAGDNFTISNTVGGTDHSFRGGSGSTLAVDTFLGGPGSISDTLTIEGRVSGTTTLTVNNTNAGPGVLNTTGIRVVNATGATPNANAFSLDAPIDAGFFSYDLFFTPTGSGHWDLRSFPGAGAQVLPQLMTAAQDMWHQGSSVWFDRTADLRVLLAGGAAPAYDGGKSLGDAPNDGIAPAVWVRGSGGWLDRDGSGSTSSNGRNYTFDLDRQLDTMDFQMGLDLGTRDLLSQGDALVFGVLGGFVHGDLDYDSINRDFDFDGGQVGIYATYLKGGLFVDTLLNVHLMELDANGALGFPNNDLDATTVGLRSDAGYRFGSFSGGAFLEPLATIEVTWADIDGFALGGNSVKFDDDANVRGRLGLRAGTTMEAWEGTMMEPFVTGSLWGNLSGENQATLASNGSTFRFEDNLEDVWGEVSAGVNFFNFSQTTSVFAKVDVTLGDDVTGLGGKAGMRVAW